MAGSTLHIFGVRHHGPGSARSLCRALKALKPDAILLEGPPDAQEIVALAKHKDMVPPVAILVYVPDEPQRAVFYPFARFSPEWQAMQYGLERKIPVRFMDLPQTHRLAIEKEERDRVLAAIAEREKEQKQEQAASGAPAAGAEPEEDDDTEGAVVPAPTEAEIAAMRIRADPLGALAEAAGYSDGERWWDAIVESRQGGDAEVFAAVQEAMATLRQEATGADNLEEQRREAHMRQTIRAALEKGHERIAIVCGAWHGPALTPEVLAAQGKADAALLKGLPKVATRCAWVPWAYDRLSYHSGYGAGIESPEWYHLLWECSEGDQTKRPTSNVQRPTFNARAAAGGEAAKDDQGTSGSWRLDVERWTLDVGSSSPVLHWFTRVARLLREQDLDASSAHVIEAVRLSEALAALRQRCLPGLAEVDEAALTVLCFGQDTPMQLIRRKLVLGERLGTLPDDVPLSPLQQDLQRLQKSLRLPATADEKDYDLDLRQPNDLQRSHLLHRLRLLGVPWGDPREAGGQKKGTFHELWRVQWKPEFVVSLIDAGRWGNTIAAAACGFAAHRAAKAANLVELAELLDDAILADLPDAVTRLVGAIQAKAAVAGDVVQLMAALPGLARVTRYGNVRQTDTAMVAQVVDGLVARVCIGLPNACSSLDDDAAKAMHQHVVDVHGAVTLLQNPSHLQAWHNVLRVLCDQANLHGLLAGRACRLLHDAAAIPADEAARRLSLALSIGNPPAAAAAWIEGFLAGSGLVLIHDRGLWDVLDQWVTGLGGDQFTEVLPLLRRTFSTFAAPERRQMGARAKSGPGRAAIPGAPAAADDFDYARADTVLPILKQLLGVS